VTAARARRGIAETIRWLMARGLYAGTSGNVSARAPGGMLITPSGVPCDAVDAASIVEVAFADGGARGLLAPSSEWRLHRDIYRGRPDVGAVVHTHSTFATALSCLRRPIPAFHYMVAKAGGDDIRCARYATYGTAALSRNALTALGGGRRACLLANHGLVALGADLASARLLAEELEALSAQYVQARAAGTPVILPAREMVRVRTKFASYGPAPIRPPVVTFFGEREVSHAGELGVGGGGGSGRGARGTGGGAARASKHQRRTGKPAVG
jgi:L-fuculose-phosphate aldolase